jgi:hypothetical protein
MIIKKIFIHIPKNAGMTIRKSRMLRDKIVVAGTNLHKSTEYTAAVLETMNKNGDHHGFEHARWRDLKPNITMFNDSFAIVRNPWDRVMSRYFFAKKVIEVEKNSAADYADISSFEAFLEERHKWGGKEYMWHRAIRGWYPALDHVTNEIGVVKCDIIRFENLNEDLCKYFNLIQMSEAHNVTGLNKGTYKDLYTSETIQIVADWYQKDIDTWGYDFDTGPKRNFWNQS